jgi:hypothetical protein
VAPEPEQCSAITGVGDEKAFDAAVLFMSFMDFIIWTRRCWTVARGGLRCEGSDVMHTRRRLDRSMRTRRVVTSSVELSRTHTAFEVAHVDRGCEVRVAAIVFGVQ